MLMCETYFFTLFRSKTHTFANLKSKMSEKTWTVVHFVKDDSVEAVPSAWLIDEDKCLWPPATWTSDKIVNAIKNCTVDTHWQDYVIKTFRNATYSNYEIARNKAKKAESGSDLSTTDMENYKRKRKRVTYSSDDDQEDNSLSSLKEPPQYNFSKSKAANKPNLLFPTDSYKTPKKAPIKQRHSSTLQSSESKFEERCILNKDLSGISKDTNNDMRGVLKGSSRASSQKEHSSENCGRCCPYQSILLQQIFKEQIKIREVLKDITTTVRTRKETSPQSKQNIFGDFQLPANEASDLQTLNEFLENESNFEKSVFEISRLGGTDNSDFVKRCLTFLVSSKLACNYSWLGRRKKLGFKDQFGQIVSLIVESSENTKKAKDRKETEDLIKSWLRRAAERTRRVQECASSSSC